MDPVTRGRAVHAAAALVAAAACGGQDVEPLALPSEPTGIVAVERADPALAVDPAGGDLLLTWIAKDSARGAILFARSRDGGRTWSPATVVAGPAADIQPHGESSPRLVAAPGLIAVAWANSVPAPGRRWPGSNIRFARSVDGGRTWTAAVTLNDDTAAAGGAGGGHLFHGAAWSGDSGLVVAWMDTRRPASNVRAAVMHEHPGVDDEPDATVYIAGSTDLGATWATSNRAAWGAACPCCRVSLARGPDGTVRATWRQHFPGNVRDVVVAPLTGDPRRVHDDGWVYPGCPHTGPAVAVDGAARTHVAWFTGREGAAGVFYARGDDSAFGAPVALAVGRTLPTAHPGVASLADGGAVVVYDVVENARRRALLAHVDAHGAVRGRVTLDAAEGADHPQVVTLAGGVVVAAWTSSAAPRSIRLARWKAW